MSAALDALDRALATVGTSVTVRRRVNTSDVWVTVNCKAVIRGYHPSELVGSIAQTDKKVILSPSAFERAQGWPGTAGGAKYPRKGDQMLVNGSPNTIQGVDVINVRDRPCRIVMQVRG